jgi:hypothetical protein
MLEHSISGESGALIGIELAGDGTLCADLLWLDSYSPDRLVFPEIGTVQFPENAIGRRNPLTILNIELKYDKLPSTI